jgi:hypothetical protein
MAAELVTGASQFLFVTDNTEGPEQLRAGIAG